MWSWNKVRAAGQSTGVAEQGLKVTVKSGHLSFIKREVYKHSSPVFYFVFNIKGF